MGSNNKIVIKKPGNNSEQGFASGDNQHNMNMMTKNFQLTKGDRPLTNLEWLDEAMELIRDGQAGRLCSEGEKLYKSLPFEFKQLCLNLEHNRQLGTVSESDLIEASNYATGIFKL